MLQKISHAFTLKSALSFSEDFSQLRNSTNETERLRFPLYLVMEQCHRLSSLFSQELWLTLSNSAALPRCHWKLRCWFQYRRTDQLFILKFGWIWIILQILQWCSHYSIIFFPSLVSRLILSICLDGIPRLNNTILQWCNSVFTVEEIAALFTS